jgi:acetyltransferase-like isoleucine patch superfamily enzyme
MQIAPTQRFDHSKHPLWSRVRSIGVDTYISDMCRIRGRLGAVEIGDLVRLHDFVCILAEGELKIGRAVYVMPHAVIAAHANLTICAGVRIGGHAQILCGTHIAREFVVAPIVIGTGACIGPGAILLPGVSIPADAQVAPNAVMGV